MKEYTRKYILFIILTICISILINTISDSHFVWIVHLAGMLCFGVLYSYLDEQYKNNK